MTVKKYTLALTSPNSHSSPVSTLQSLQPCLYLAITPVLSLSCSHSSPVSILQSLQSCLYLTATPALSLPYSHSSPVSTLQSLQPCVYLTATPALCRPYSHSSPVSTLQSLQPCVNLTATPVLCLPYSQRRSPLKLLDWPLPKPETAESDNLLAASVGCNVTYHYLLKDLKNAWNLYIRVCIAHFEIKNTHVIYLTLRKDMWQVGKCSRFNITVHLFTLFIN